MGVSDGQPVSAAVTNPAFINKNIDDTTPSKLGLGDTDPVSGTAVTNTQREYNALWSFLGGLINQVKTYKPTWASNNFGSAANDVQTKVTAIDAAFSSGGTQQMQTSRISLGNAAITGNVTFTTAFGDANYALVVQIENSTDGSPIFLQTLITFRDQTGFTFVFNAPTDSGNYILHYFARKAV